MAFDFIYQPRPGRVVFGAGSLQYLEREIALLGAQRALVLCTPGQRDTAESIARRLGSRSAGIFDRAVMHVPVEVAREAGALAGELRADCAVAVGGGSTIGLGKAIALDCGLPILAIPTTFAGSEMTPIFGLTENGLKRTGRDLAVLPKTVIYDPELTLTLPRDVALYSAMNALAHAAEGLYARDANPMTDLMAQEAISALARGVAGIGQSSDDIDARRLVLYGAWLAGTVLGSVGMSLHHKLCHTLGGALNLPHAQTHTIVLPHALAYNANAAPVAMQRIARALETKHAPMGVYELARSNGALVALRDLGVAVRDLDRVADLACQNPYWNPRPLDRASIRTLLQSAFDGAPPDA
jgi:maleylacetate reductase